MKLPNFKIRCSAIGNIMSEPRSKADKESGKLSQTTKTYVDEWIKEQIYGTKKDITNKYILKGLQCEDEAIELLAINDSDFYEKNEQFFENDFMTGTPDIITNSKILDTKCSWDCFSFPLLESELPDKSYYWQMQGYMELTGKKVAEVCYCIVNTPLELQYNTTDATDYNQLDLKYRVKKFEVKYDPESIEKIQLRVEQIRQYINEI